MPTTPIGGAPYPTGADADNVPSDMMALAIWMSTNASMRFADGPARDAAITTLDGGMVAWLDNPGCLTLYTGSAWVVAWAPLNWTNISLTLGYTAYSSTPQVTRDGNFVVCRGSLKKVSEAAIPTETIVATLPSTYGSLVVGEYPVANQWTSQTAGRIYVDSSRRIMYVGPDVGWFSLNGLRIPIGS